MSNLTTYKFVFTAYLGAFNLNAKVSCPIHATWKRSGESAVTSEVPMTDGKANFQEQSLQINVNMYLDKSTETFQQKKSSFTFTMKTPKGEKMAGTVYIDLSKILNNKLEQFKDTFPLEKCPVAGATAFIRITSTFKGEKTGDTMSVASVSMIGNESIVSVSNESQMIPKEPKSNKKNEGKEQQPNDPKEKQIKRLKELVETLTKEKQGLQKELEQTKKSLKGNASNEEILKSRALQERLQQEVNTLKKQNESHEQQLESVRAKMEQVYNNLHKNLSPHFL